MQKRSRTISFGCRSSSCQTGGANPTANARHTDSPSLLVTLTRPCRRCPGLSLATQSIARQPDNLIMITEGEGSRSFQGTSHPTPHGGLHRCSDVVHHMLQRIALVSEPPDVAVGATTTATRAPSAAGVMCATSESPSLLTGPELQTLLYHCYHTSNDTNSGGTTATATGHDEGFAAVEDGELRSLVRALEQRVVAASRARILESAVQMLRHHQRDLGSSPTQVATALNQVRTVLGLCAPTILCLSWRTFSLSSLYECDAVGLAIWNDAHWTPLTILFVPMPQLPVADAPRNGAAHHPPARVGGGPGRPCLGGNATAAPSPPSPQLGGRGSGSGCRGTGTIAPVQALGPIPQSDRASPPDSRDCRATEIPVVEAVPGSIVERGSFQTPKHGQWHRSRGP